MVEVRGIVNKDGTISFGEHTQYDSEFDLQAYENMLEYYHGMCKELCVKWIGLQKAKYKQYNVFEGRLINW